MHRILVLYATTEGQTAKIAAAIADATRTAGALVNVAAAGSGAPVPDDYDGVIVAASVHGGSYQAAVTEWVRRNAGALQGRPTTFVSVCLGVLQKDEKVQRDLEAIVERFTTATGWLPGRVEMVAGALRYSKYPWYVRWMMRRIAARAGGDTDTSRDYEYTDWRQVERIGREFAASLPAASRRERVTA